jgi:hypothetical protein
MQITIPNDETCVTVGKTSITNIDAPAQARFGKCKMCSCSGYKTSSNDWQFCDCGHSRSQHQS